LPARRAPAWSCAAAPVSAAIPTKIKVVSIHFIRIFVSVFDFTLVSKTRVNETGLGLGRDSAPRRKPAEPLGDLLDRYSRKIGVSVIVQGGSCVHPSPKDRGPGIVAESLSDYIGFAPGYLPGGGADRRN